jgi:hypothetical protein
LYRVLILNHQEKSCKSDIKSFEQHLSMNANWTPKLEVQLIRSFRQSARRDVVALGQYH